MTQCLWVSDAISHAPWSVMTGNVKLGFPLLIGNMYITIRVYTCINRSSSIEFDFLGQNINYCQTKLYLVIMWIDTFLMEFFYWRYQTTCTFPQALWQQNLPTDLYASITDWGHYISALQWRHNEHDGISNHRCINCLLNRLSRRRSKKTSELRVTGLVRGIDQLPVIPGYWPGTKGH